MAHLSPIYTPRPLSLKERIKLPWRVEVSSYSASTTSGAVNQAMTHRGPRDASCFRTVTARCPIAFHSPHLAHSTTGLTRFQAVSETFFSSLRDARRCGSVHSSIVISGANKLVPHQVKWLWLFTWRLMTLSGLGVRYRRMGVAWCVYLFFCGHSALAAAPAFEIYWAFVPYDVIRCVRADGFRLADI